MIEFNLLEKARNNVKEAKERIAVERAALLIEIRNSIHQDVLTSSNSNSEFCIIYEDNYRSEEHVKTVVSELKEQGFTVDVRHGSRTSYTIRWNETNE